MQSISHAFSHFVKRSDCRVERSGLIVASYFPSLAVFFGKVLVGCRNVRDRHRIRIEFNRLPDTIGDVSEQHDFGKRAGIAEGTAGAASGLTGVDPLLMMSGRCRQKRFRSLEVDEPVFGQQLWKAIVLNRDAPLVADGTSNGSLTALSLAYRGWPCAPHRPPRWPRGRGSRRRRSDC